MKKVEKFVTWKSETLHKWREKVEKVEKSIAGKRKSLPKWQR